MLLVVKKTISTQWRRFALTGVVVALSVGFMALMLIQSESIAGNAVDDIATAYVETDMVVEGAVIDEGGGGPGELAIPTRETLTAEQVDQVRSVAGVSDAVGVVQGFSKLVRDGETLGAGTAVDLGSTWIGNERLNPFELVDGSSPNSDQVVIDQLVAEQSNVKVGDRVQVVTASGIHAMSVSGIARFGPASSAPGLRSVLFASEQARELLDRSTFDSIRLELADGTSASTVASSIRSELGTAEVSTGAKYTADQQGRVTAPLSFLSTFLLAFAVITTVAGATIIYNTFTMALLQRRRELALLRGVGALPKQIVRLVLLEALAVGSIATAVGVGLGIGLVGVVRSVMRRLGVSFFAGDVVVSARSLAIAIVVGVGVTVLSAWISAKKTASVSPVEAIGVSVSEPRQVSRLSQALGLTLIALAVAGTGIAVATQSAIFLIFTAMIAPGLVLAGPTLFHIWVRVARGFEAIMVFVGWLAVTNLSRHLRRSASTALAVALGVTLIGFFTVVASSLTASISTDLDSSVRSTFVVDSVSADFATVDPGLAERLAQIEGVNQAVPIASYDGQVHHEGATIGGFDPEVIDEVFAFDVLEGSLDGLSQGGVAIVTDGLEPGPGIGDTVEVVFGESTLQAPVAALVSNSLGGFDAPEYFVSTSTLADNQPGLLDRLVLVDSSTDSREAIVNEVANTPGSLFKTKSEFVGDAGSEIAQFRNLIYSLLSMMLIIAVVGVANTMTLSTSERVREIGLLRAVGMSKPAIVKTLLVEAAFVTFTGTLIGLLVGVGASWALISVSGGADLPVVSIPWLVLAVVAVGASIAGTVAGGLPALRASRVPVLTATASA